ncbi:MAG: hypothetical protein RBU37_03410, partial [Myxococcota bacterium]|nr:hypothetical protein [Myxococcota bacterium]
MTQEQLSNAENGSSSDESTELSWPDRVEQLLDLAREQDGVQAAQTYLSAMQLIDLKNPGDFQISEVWSYALQQIPGQAAWLWTEGSRSLSQSAELWQQIAAAHQGVMSAVDDDAAQVVGEAWGWVQLFRAGELDAGKERLKPYAEANPEGYTAQMLEALAVAESGNWRKAEMTLDEKLKESGLSAEQLSEEQALRVSDLAMALSSVDRAVEVIRRAQRAQAESAALRSRMAVMYRDTAKWNAYVDVLKDLVARQEQKQAKIDLLHEMIRIYSDEMKLDAMVVKSYEALLEADPGNKGALEALAAAYENARRWPDLVSLLAQQASSASTPAARAEMNLRVAKVYLEKLSRQVDAIKYYEAVLEDAPHETESLTQLKELYEKRREWEKLIDIHRREVEAMTDPVEQATRLKEVADIATSKLRKAPVAIEIWREVLRYAETDLEALNALEGLYEREKAWPELAEICERKAALEDDQAARSKLWQKIGLLYSERINEAEGAIRAWRAVLELDPSHPKAAESLRKLLIETKSWDDLEAFYHERNSAAELVKLLESLANTSKEAEDVIELLFRSATVWQESLETPERAVKALEKIFETDAQNARAAARLVPYYEAASDHEQLVAMLKIQHQKETELEERVQLSLRLASLCELALEDAAQAYTWLRWVMTANAEYTQAYDDFERVGIVVGRAADVVAVYERAIAEPSEGLDVRELRFRMGQVMANELAQVDEALAIFEGILEHEPDNLRALGALESILDRTGRYDELIAVNERRLKLATEPAEEAEILLSGARIHEMQRGDRATAIQFYERVRELVPKDERSLVELHRLYRESGDSEALANVLRARLGLLEEASQGGPLEPEAAIPLWYELGQVAQTDLAEHDEAVECYRKIILAEPEHDEARSALEGLLENGVEGAKIALILEPVYELRADYAALVGVLRVQFDHQRELPEQIDLLIRIGRLHRDQLGQLDEAFQALAQALELAPTRQDVLEELEAITDLLADWPRLVSALEQVAAGIDELTLRTSYDLTLARLYEQQLESPEQAHEYGRAALARGGSDPAVLDTLFELYTRTEAWNDLLDVLERKVEVAAPDVEAQRELKLTIAAVLEEKLAAKDDAIQVYLGVLQDEPSNEASLGSLDRLYAELERWDEAAANFGRRLDLLEDELEKDVVRCKLAKVLERHLGEPERAIEIYRGVLERDASNATALADMEQMLETAELFAAEQIAEILLPLYDALGDWEKRAWVNEMLLRVVDEPSRRCALLHEIASLFEERGQQYEEAFVAYSRALAEDPANEHSLSQLYRYADALDIWAELVGVLQKTTDSITDAILAKETQVRMAKIYREKLDDLAGATAAYEKAADFDPDDESILDALELIYREQSAWEPLTQTLVKKSARSYDPEPKKQLLFQAAMICEEMLQEVERATDLYQEILGIDPDDIDSVDSLERLYTSMQRWNDLMSIYNIKIERAQGGEEQKQLYYVVGALQEQQLDDAFGAIETYRKALDIDPEDAQALEALDRLYLGSEDWMNLLEILEREENVAAEVEAKLALRYRQGDVWHRHLNEGLRAIEVYHSVLEIDAAYQQALDSLEEIIAEGEFAVDAARVLEPVYDALAEWDKLIAVYEVLVSHADDPEERIRLLMTIGRVREEMQAQVEQAFDAYFRALQEDPRRDSTWDTLERIAAAFDFWPTLVERGKALLDESADSDSAIAIASRLATINEQYLEAFMEAVAMWQRVVEIEPTELRAIQALDQLYERQTMWPELAETLQREIELAIETDELIRLRYRLGTINENFLENVPEAINSYNEILLLQPGQEDAIEALVRMFSAGLGQVEIGAILEPFYRETEQWENLVQVGLALIEHFDTATDRYQKLLDLAEIYLGPLANAADGLVIYGRALIERPDDEFALTRLEELAELTQEWGQAVQFHVAALQATDDPVVQRGLLWHIAQAYDQKIGDATQAEEAYRQMLQLDPEAMEAWEALDRIFLGQMRWEDLGEVIKNEITYAQDDSQRIAFYLRLGEVQNEMLGLSDDAIASFRAVIDIDPTQLDALSALERIHESRQEWALLFEVLGQRATVAMDDDERAMLWARMAQIASELLDRRQEAIDLWYQVIDVKGDNLLSLQSLEMLFQLDDRWADMTDVIERQVSLVESGEEQLEAYRKLGRIWAGPLENQERSIEYWRKAMQVNPEDLETLQAIKAIDEAFTDYEDLVDIIRRLVALGALPYEEQLAHFVQLAELLTQILIRPEEAIETWIQVLQLDPSHMQALNALEQLYVDAMRWEDAVAVLEQKAELVPTDEGIRLRMQVAEIWETQVDNPELAGNAYLGVLAMEPLHEEAFARLEALYERTENWDAMQNLFVDRAGALETDNERIAMLRRAAVIAEEKLGSPDVSFVILQSALHINKKDQDIAEDLERLADLTKSWRELVALYEGFIQDVSDPKEALELHNNVARWYFHKLNDAQASWQHFQVVLGIDPNNLNALAALIEIYRRLGNWQEFINLTVRLADLTPEPEDKASRFTEIAVAWEKQLGSVDQAIAAYREVLKVDDANLNALRQ